MQNPASSLILIRTQMSYPYWTHHGMIGPGWTLALFGGDGRSPDDEWWVFLNCKEAATLSTATASSSCGNWKFRCQPLNSIQASVHRQREAAAPGDVALCRFSARSAVDARWPARLGLASSQEPGSPQLVRPGQPLSPVFYQLHQERKRQVEHGSCLDHCSSRSVTKAFGAIAAHNLLAIMFHATRSLTTSLPMPTKSRYRVRTPHVWQFPLQCLLIFLHIYGTANPKSERSDRNDIQDSLNNCNNHCLCAFDLLPK